MTDGLFSDLNLSEVPAHELTIWDKNEPRSLINIVWVDMVPIIERASIACKELLQLPERKLKAKVKPEPLDDMLRLRFWQEYDRAQMLGGKMMQKDIIRGLCSKDYWEDSVCRSPEKLSWMLLPLASYITRMESSLYIALDEVEDILRLPHVDSKGRVDTRLIAEKVKIYQLLELRVKGAVVQKLAVHQRVDQRTQVFKDPLNDMPLDDLEALDGAIQRVKRLTERMQNRESYLPEMREQPKEVLDIAFTGEKTIAEKVEEEIALEKEMRVGTVEGERVEGESE